MTSGSHSTYKTCAAWKSHFVQHFGSGFDATLETEARLEGELQSDIEANVSVNLFRDDALMLQCIILH